MAKIKMDKLKQHSVFITLIIAYLILFLPFVGTVPLFDWDEINFAEAAREMIVTGDWLNVQIGFEPFWEKPPLFIWLQAICMTLVGVNEFAARLPNVLIGLITLVVLYATLLKRYGKQAGIFSVLFYLGSFTSHFYFKSGIIDPLFNLLIFGSIIHLVKSVETQKRTYFFYAGLWLGLAVLTKGPTALLLVGLTGLFYQLIYRINFYAFKDILLLILGFFLVTGLYFGVQIAHMGTWFLREFIVYQVDLFRYPIASHGQPFYYHLVVLLIGCFPMFILALPGLLGKQNVSGDSTYYRWLKVLFWVVLIVFSLVTTKIVHYSSLCYLPIAAVSGIWLSRYEGISGI
ncbi:MAG TPA: glycosyl transferase, partial [Bacteroidetes bacterium]|nr:glycosyl transferase [Bacteroidota bacterium]